MPSAPCSWRSLEIHLVPHGAITHKQNNLTTATIEGLPRFLLPGLFFGQAQHLRRKAAEKALLHASTGASKAC